MMRSFATLLAGLFVAWTSIGGPAPPAGTWSGRVAPTAPVEQQFRQVLTRDDYERLFEQPFDVAPGTRRIEVEYSASGADARTVVDLGLRGPSGLRGWSGGGSSRIWISALGASSGYLPGPIEPGAWAVMLGVPNIRAGRRDTVTVTVRTFDDDLPASSAIAPRGAGWFVGDLHVHSAHSDGRLRSRRGTRVGTPAHKVFDAAAAAGLDFVALTDHNTASHWLDVERLQPFYDDLLLLHGREVTTYRGHATTVGERRFDDFRLARPDASPAGVLAPIADAGAFVSLNHPALPDGEACMGCGWNDTGPDVIRHVHGVEVVNGDTAAGPLAGWRVWARLVTEGHRLTAVGGSDDHAVDDDADRQVGRPATVVFARELSESALVEALRGGRAYVRVRGPAGPVLETFQAARGGLTAQMGEVLAGAGAPVVLTASIGAASGQTVQWVVDGREVGSAVIGAQPLSFEVRDSAARWVTVVVRDQDGPTLMASAIYLGR